MYPTNEDHKHPTRRLREETRNVRPHLQPITRDESLCGDVLRLYAIAWYPFLGPLGPVALTYANALAGVLP